MQWTLFCILLMTGRTTLWRAGLAWRGEACCARLLPLNNDIVVREHLIYDLSAVSSSDEPKSSFFNSIRHQLVY